MKISSKAKPIVVAAALLGGICALSTTPAMAAGASGMTLNPTSGQFQFGQGSPSDKLNLVAPVASCPSGSSNFISAFTAAGAESSILDTGAALTDLVTLPGDGTIPAQQGDFNGVSSGAVQNLLEGDLPVGDTSTELTPEDAAKVGQTIYQQVWDVVGVCFSDSVQATYVTPVQISAVVRPPEPADEHLPTGQKYQLLQWSWKVQGGDSSAQATTTTLTANPASAGAGDAVSLTATLDSAAAGATGTMEFFDGSTSLGTKPVTAGAASLTTTTLAAGGHNLKAVFTPDAASAGQFAGSTSSTVAYTITAGGGNNPAGQTGTVTVQTTVDEQTSPESLTLTVDPNAPVDLGTPQREGDNLVASASDVDLATVTDTRQTDKPGWNVTGQIGDDFVGSSDATHTFSGTALGWTPKIDSDGGTGANAAAPVAAGSNPGLTGNGATLASTSQGAGIGTAKLGADLSLLFPATTPADTYRADVTITAL